MWFANSASFIAALQHGLRHVTCWTIAAGARHACRFSPAARLTGAVSQQC
jgi:hypothetical protein